MGVFIVEGGITTMFDIWQILGTPQAAEITALITIALSLFQNVKTEKKLLIEELLDHPADPQAEHC